MHNVSTVLHGSDSSDLITVIIPKPIIFNYVKEDVLERNFINFEVKRTSENNFKIFKNEEVFINHPQARGIAKIRTLELTLVTEHGDVKPTDPLWGFCLQLDTAQKSLYNELSRLNLLHDVLGD